MDKGVDGMITDYPDRLRELMADRGLRLPRAYDARRARTRNRFGRHADNALHRLIRLDR